MEALSTIRIIEPVINEQYDQVRFLIRAFVNWHRQRHEGTSLTDDYFNPAALEQELASLPLKYATGRNKLILALNEAEAAGCVTLREMDGLNCEMKRMFVQEKLQGKGIGKILVQEIVQRAKQAGFSSMKLETSIRQTEAQKLYESLGFKRIAPYYAVPKSVQDWLVFMELKL